MSFQSITELLEKADNLGAQWAHSCAPTSLKPEDKEHLENVALTTIPHLASKPFNKEENPEDALTQCQHDQRLRDREDADMALEHAKLEVRKCEQELADHVVPERPETSTVVVICGTALFAAGCAVGLVDWTREHITTDSVLAGMLAFSFGLALGLFVTTSVYNTDSPKRREWGLIAGLGLSFSAGFLRFAFSGGGLLTAVALTAFELAVVGLLDWRGRHLTEQFEIWREKNTERVRRQQRKEAAEQHQTRAADTLREFDAQIEAHHQMVAARSTCAKMFPEIQEAVKRAAVVAAQNVIAEKRGIKRGVIPINSRKELSA